MAANLSATVLYVDVNSTNPTPPFTNWITAATNIQDAVNVATSSDTVLVTNGVYRYGGRVVSGALTNRIALTKVIALQSVNGPSATVVDGGGVARCVYLTNGAAIAGLALTNGTADSGGGIYSEAGGRATNCVIRGNSASQYGGGVLGGTLDTCTLSNNWGGWYGGGAAYCTLKRCILAYNGTETEGGAAFQCTLDNCIVYGNSSIESGAGIGQCIADNCSLANNSDGAILSTLNNCIVYYNSSGNYSDCSLNNCCTTPVPDSGVNNITNEPLFLDLFSSNFHLQTNSPCINAGSNSYVTNTYDLDGSPRIRGGTVDIGAYEFQTPTSVISYAWLQQYGLPSDGSADFADTDNDGINNWQEWIAGTDPTNRLSVLQMLAVSNSLSGITVSWQSVTGRTYYLQRGTNLLQAPALPALQSDIVGQAGMTSFTDTTATNAGPYFYRVGVQ